MKQLRYFTFSLLCILTAYSLWAANDPDLSKGIDLTGQSSVTPYQLNQLVDAGTVRTNRGLFILTNAAPDVVSYPRYTNWVWLDQASIPFVLKTWNANSNAWIAVSFGTNAITTAQIGDGQVTTPKLANGAVDSDKLGDNSVIESKIVAGQVSASKMANNAITTLSITNGAVTSDKIAINGVITTNILDGAVTSNKLAAASITSDKFAPGAIGAVSISDNSITSIKIVTGGVVGTNLADNIVSTNKISFALWISTNQTTTLPAAGANATFTHTFAGIPQQVRVVLICTSPNLNYSINDEVDITTFTDASAANEPAFVCYASASALVVMRTSEAANIRVADKTGFTRANINTALWSVKYYATYFPIPN
jgi:hypothetical protein